MALDVISAVFFVLGALAFAGAAIYYSRAKVVHAAAEELNAQVLRDHEINRAALRKGEELLAQIQEHAVL